MSPTVQFLYLDFRIGHKRMVKKRNIKEDTCREIWSGERSWKRKALVIVFGELDSWVILADLYPA